MTNRDSIIDQFVSAHGWGGSNRVSMREDASARKYYRLNLGAKTAIIMDAAPPFEEVNNFYKTAEIFRNYGWSVPQIFARDERHGLLLTEDFGSQSFADAMRAGTPAQNLYDTAIDNLIHLHRQDPAAGAQKLPPLSNERLIYLVTWMIEWYVPLIQPQTLSRTIREKFVDLWTEAFDTMREVPIHAIHLDYQFHNLMLLPNRAGHAACGVLDFQDACYGPITADLVMLLQDAREDVPDAITSHALQRYLAAFPAISQEKFMASYAIFAAHNAARILGLFARLKMRDGKGQYLKHIPRNLAYLEKNLLHPALAPIREWFDTHVPRAKRLQMPDLAT